MALAWILVVTTLAWIGDAGRCCDGAPARVEGAADLAAVSAASRLQRGGDPCGQRRLIASSQRRVAPVLPQSMAPTLSSRSADRAVVAVFDLQATRCGRPAPVRRTADWRRTRQRSRGAESKCSSGPRPPVARRGLGPRAAAVADAAPFARAGLLVGVRALAEVLHFCSALSGCASARSRGARSRAPASAGSGHRLRNRPRIGVDREPLEVDPHRVAATEDDGRDGQRHADEDQETQ